MITRLVNPLAHPSSKLPCGVVSAVVTVWDLPDDLPGATTNTPTSNAMATTWVKPSVVHPVEFDAQKVAATTNDLATLVAELSQAKSDLDRAQYSYDNLADRLTEKRREFTALTASLVVPRG